MSENQQEFEGLNGGKRLQRIGRLMAAMLASVALLCVAAPGASAVEPVGIYLAGEESEEEASQPRIEAESYPVDIQGGALSTHKFTFQAGSLMCPIADSRSEASSATATLRLQVSYLLCTTQPATMPQIFMNGCEYDLNVLNAGPPYAGALDVVCPSKTGIQIIAKSSPTITLCTITIHPQTGIEGISLENTGVGSERSIVVDYNLSGIAYSQQKGPIAGCETGEFENGTYTGESLLSGEEVE